jgi:hypothetical protein
MASTGITCPRATLPPCAGAVSATPPACTAPPPEASNGLRQAKVAAPMVNAHTGMPLSAARSITSAPSGVPSNRQPGLHAGMKTSAA